MIELRATRLTLDGSEVHVEPVGGLLGRVRRHLCGHGPPGLVVLGRFGSGKTSMCAELASARREGELPTTVVPLRVVARHGEVVDGLRQVVGRVRLDEARAGQRVLLLDGWDEIPRPADSTYAELFEELVSQAGPRWVLTSRPGHFRTDAAETDPDQVDALEREATAILRIEPLPLEVVRAEVGVVAGGADLLDSVEGLEILATSPLLLHVVHAALPYIEPGRPIHPWGVFDAWVRHGLYTGPRHDHALRALEDLAWSSVGRGALAVGDLDHDALGRIPGDLRRALLVTDIDGRLRFGHRAVHEFLLAARTAPRLTSSQGHGPDELSGLRLTEAVRVFLVGRTPPMPVRYEGDRVHIPRGNYVAGGDLSSDERPLRIEHLAEPVWMARVPVTNRDWARYLEARPDPRVDAHYLRHWGVDRQLPVGQEDAPVHHIWPEDADRYAAWAGARLPRADEWEKAVRGLDGRRWPWGDTWQPDRAVTAETGVVRPLPVAAFGSQGQAGLFSAIGGVFEYTSTSWRGHSNRGRVVMGGCYTHPWQTSRASLRLSHKLSGNLKAGLRLAWDG